MKETPTSDEKVLAALAHGAVLFSFLGPIGPAIIWASQRKKSKYVAFHALQAMGYQAFSFWAWFVAIFVVIFGGMCVVTAASTIAIQANYDDPFFMFLLQPLILLAIFGLWGIFFLIGIVGAVYCMMGRDFHYPFFGRWLDRKLHGEAESESAFSEQWEENWVSGICHSTAILNLWGVITPLIVWFSQKDRSAKLRFHSLQAIFYQLTAIAAYILWMVVYMFMYFVFIFGLLGLGTLNPETASGDFPSAFGAVILAVMFIFVLMMLLMMVAWPIYLLLALIASIRTARGHDYRYPILGGILARRLKPLHQSEASLA